jgi:hypothetical protein
MGQNTREFLRRAAPNKAEKWRQNFAAAPSGLSTIVFIVARHMDHAFAFLRFELPLDFLAVAGRRGDHLLSASPSPGTSMPYVREESVLPRLNSSRGPKLFNLNRAGKVLAAFRLSRSQL